MYTNEDSEKQRLIKELNAAGNGLRAEYQMLVRQKNEGSITSDYFAQEATRILKSINAFNENIVSKEQGGPSA